MRNIVFVYFDKACYSSYYSRYIQNCDLLTGVPNFPYFHFIYIYLYCFVKYSFHLFNIQNHLFYMLLISFRWCHVKIVSSFLFYCHILMAFFIQRSCHFDGYDASFFEKGQLFCLSSAINVDHIFLVQRQCQHCS